ncbi:MAG: Hint domain-containing protein [Rhodobacteraceae bacterium]|nr:Hint domain-containing protein [Paracoccaceae bacterium]
MTTPLPIQTFLVYPAEMMRVSHGANLNEAISAARDLVHDDIYELSKKAEYKHLAISTRDDTGDFFIAAGSGLGQPGAALYLDCLITFMGPHGTTEEALVLIETDPNTGMIAQTYLHPLTPLAAKTGYTLVTIDPDGARTKLAESACVSFTRSTAITMADGRQVPVEHLQPGDRVLTRDSGPQKLRWIGEQTLRASGAFAPIVIAPGALNNTGELVVSQNHRLFIYQRADKMGAGQSEVLVKARDLVNDTSVVRAEGGFVDYFQLLFDKHEIIYAEGIASESLFIDTTTRSVVPEEIQKRLKSVAKPVRAGHELKATDLASSDAVALLKRASEGPREPRAAETVATFKNRANSVGISRKLAG